MRVLWFAIAMALCGCGAYAVDKPELITNPGFERGVGKADGWSAYVDGYTLDSAVAHSGQRCARCSTANSGVSYTVALNQTVASPVLVTGWSRAQDVGGTRDDDYSIYVDLVYTDGTPLYGQVASFRTGTHDWQHATVLIVPAKPLRSATIYGLFRKHSGTAWFDDFSAMQLSAANLFDSQAIAPPALPKSAQSGWYARDVVADGPVQPLLVGGKPADGAKALGLRATALKPALGGRETRIEVTDTRGVDRAITLYYVERFSVSNPVWGHDMRQSRPVTAGEVNNYTRSSTGLNGMLSLYPFGCVYGGGKGRMVGVNPLDPPTVCRIAYNQPNKLLYIAYDVCLTGNSKRWSDGAGHGRVQVAAFSSSIDPAWGFRSAAQTYYRAYPEAFTRRAKAEGLWVAFTDPSTIQGIQDFGIAYHEGDNNLAGDQKLGILSFRYTEPMTWWMSMPKEMPRTYEAAIELARQHAGNPKDSLQQMAQALLNSGGKDQEGRFNVQFADTPWTNGAVWALNPNPYMPCPADQYTKAKTAYTKVYADKVYSPQASVEQSGEYLDSIEGWSEYLDFNPVALQYTLVPPSFTIDERKPVLPTWCSVWSFTRYLRDDLRARNKLLMANATPWRFWVFLPLLDVAGTETNWNPDNKWRPDSDDVFNLRRTLCYHKPYLLLQNTDFDKFGVDKVERYMARSMFYAVFPSMFSVDASNRPYWSEPNWYNRDRELFKRYIPVIKRLSAAGWEPITYARTEGDGVWVERYGKTMFTLMNSTATTQPCQLRIDMRALGLQGQSITAHNLMDSAKTYTVRDGVMTIDSMAPDEVIAVEMK